MLPPTLLAQLDKVWPIVSAAPDLTGLILFGCLALSLGLMHLLYRRELKTKVAEIGLLSREKEVAEKKLAEALADLARLKNEAGNAALGAPAEPSGNRRARLGGLEFVFGESHPFSEHAIDPAGTEWRFVRVALLNTGDAHLDECQAVIEQMVPGPEGAAGTPFFPLALTADGFPLRPGGRKVLDIAAHQERHPDGTASPSVTIMAQRRVFAVTVAAEKPQSLCLRAFTPEGLFTEATCRLLVDAGRLRLTAS